MGLEVLDERIEFEARRVAAAFGVEEWGDIAGDSFGRSFFKELEKEICLGLSVDTHGRVDRLDVHNQEHSFTYYELYFREGIAHLWVAASYPKYGELMARGLYRLGFSDESILSQLPQLSAHEKIELRLSMPQEFWPQAWLEELKR